ncbi:MAG: hypothetical protein Q9227_007958 [Pyrenula ochraceoflavens]
MPKIPLLAKRQTCMGQSCVIADLSGSTGRPFTATSPPDGGTTAGDCCIISYNPAVRAQLEAFNPNITTTCPATARRSLHIERQTACLPYTLLYARGTTEPGTLGITVGPALAAQLEVDDPGKWNIVGVPYDASTDGDYCLGLPGGAVLTPLLESTASSCPDTKIIVSGYSQGALVAHNGVASATQEAKDRVNAIVVFGDPFDGAPIKGYNGPVQTYCAAGDEVCDGEFEISAAHLSYAVTDIIPAANYIQTVIQ